MNTDRADALAPRDAAPAQAPPRPAALRPRIWPGVVIVTAYVLAAAVYRQLVSTGFANLAGLLIIPAATEVLLLAWWIIASRTRWYDRLLGAALFVATQLPILFAPDTKGMLLFAYAAPALNIGVVFTLVVTIRAPWRIRRWIAVGFLAAFSAALALMRPDTIYGNMAPIVSWRWQPTDASRSAALPPPEAHGTAVLPPQATAEDWPGFRGAARDGCVRGVTFSTQWGAPLRERWRKPCGPAWSSFAVVGDYFFTQEQRGDEELVTCGRLDSGDAVWVNQTHARYEDGTGLGPRATPIFDRGKLYVQGCAGALQCLDASTGATLWKRDLLQDAETGTPQYGFASSPLVVGELVIAFASAQEGKSAIAYDRATGSVVWRSGHGTAVYPSPHRFTMNGIEQVLMASDFGIQSLDIRTGASLWEHPFAATGQTRCVQPLLAGDGLILVGTSGDAGSHLLRVSENAGVWSVEQVWATSQFRPYFNDAVLHKGFVYGFDGDRLVCLDLKTGERKWQSKHYGGQVLLLADMNTLLVLTERGEVALVPAEPDSFREIARFKALAGKTWNHPVVARGCLLVRNANEAACFELPGFRVLPNLPQ